MPNFAQVIPTLTEKERESLALVTDAFWNAHNNKVDIERKWDDFLAIYNAYRDKPKGPDGVTRSRIATPMGYTAVESSTAKIRSNILPNNPNDPMIRFLARGVEDIEKAEASEKWLQFSFERVNHRIKIEKAARDFSLYGLTVAYPKWKFVKKKRKLRVPITDQGSTIELTEPRQVEQIIADHPDFEVGSVRSFYPDPSAEEFTPDKLRYVVRENFVPYAELRDLVQADETGLYNKSAFSKLDPDSLPDRITNHSVTGNFRNTSYYRSFQDNFRKVKGLNGYVKIWEYWSKEKYIVIADEVVPIIDTDSELWSYQIPVVIAVRQPRVGFPWGKSILEPIEKIISHVDGLRNAEIDQINKALHPPIKVRKGAGIDKTKLMNLGPYDTIEMVNMEDIEAFEYPDVTSKGFQMETTLVADLNSATSNVGVASGDIPANIRSTTQQLSTLELVEERNKADIDDFAEMFILPLGKIFLEFGQLFMTRNEIVRLTDDPNADIRIVRPYDLIAMFDLKMATQARTLPKAVEANQKLIFLQQVQLILQNPQGIGDDIIRLWADAAGDLGYKKIELVLRKLLPEFVGRRFLAPNNLIQPIAPNGSNGAIEGGTTGDTQNTPQTEASVLDSLNVGRSN